MNYKAKYWQRKEKQMLNNIERGLEVVQYFDLKEYIDSRFIPFVTGCENPEGGEVFLPLMIGDVVMREEW